MGNENQNVLDFLNDTTNVNNTNIGNSTSPNNNNNNNNNNYKKFNLKNSKWIFIIIGIVIILSLGFFSYKIISKNDKSDNTKNKNEEPLRTKSELLDYKIDVDLSNEFEFSVNITLITDYLNTGSTIYNIPKTNDITEIYDVKMNSSNNMETSRSEDDDNYYFKFGNDTDRFTDKITHKISYKYVNEILLDSTKFTFLDDISGQVIPNFELSITIPMEFIDDIEFKFNHELDCTTNYNTTTCKAKNLDGYSKIDATFMQKRKEQSLTPSNGYQQFMIPVSVIANSDNLKSYKIGDYINIKSNGINEHTNLTGEFIKNVRILDFKNYSNNTISSSDLKNLAFVTVEVNTEMSNLLSNIPYASNYLNLSIEKSDNSNPPRLIQSEITQFIDSMSY